MMSADVKADVKQEAIKEMALHLIIFIRSIYSQNLK